MTARSVLQEAVVAALRGAGLTAFDAPPVRAALPHCVVDEAVLQDWSTKTWAGREGRIVVRFLDSGERPVRLRDAIEAGEAAVTAIGRTMPEGWRLVQMRVARSRLARSGDGWLGLSEFAVRMWREG
jgi:hypothetical protein